VRPSAADVLGERPEIAEPFIDGIVEELTDLPSRQDPVEA
jgi:hypothetical protein